MPDDCAAARDIAERADATGPVCLIANRASGRNARDRDAVDRAARVLGAEICDSGGGGGLKAALDKAVARKPRLIVAAGGDGTAMAVANALHGTDIAMGVLPLGTFNYFARGLGLSEDPEQAAQQLAGGTVQPIRAARVNGQVFLNNASVGVYPTILKERETVYRRWGRWRVMAHWSVLRTFAQFRKPLRLTMQMDGETVRRRTALVFVGRSAFQLDRFRLAGAEAVRDGALAVLVVRAETRRDLLRRTIRLATRTVEEGVDYDFYRCQSLTLELTGRRRTLLAYDGEKRRFTGPLRFEIPDTVLRIVVPRRE